MNRKIIITPAQYTQLLEGESFRYMDRMAATPDLGNISATEITTSGEMEDAYPDPVTSDDMANTMTNDWRGNAKLAGMGPVVVHEMTKREWHRRNICSEESEHGNARLSGRTFGAQNGNPGKSYAATKMAVSRKRAAENKLNSQNPEERAKAAETLRHMRNNWSGIDTAESQYDAAKLSDKLMRKDMTGPKIASGPKVSGNGKGHSNGGVFLNQ